MDKKTLEQINELKQIIYDTERLGQDVTLLKMRLQMLYSKPVRQNKRPRITIL